MKALLLVHGLDVGGAEGMVAAIARHLRRRGDTVEIGCLGEFGTLGAELRAEGIPVLVHPRRPGFDATLPWRLAARVRSGRFEVVHAHQRTALFYALLAGLLHTVPIAYAEHGPRFASPAHARQRAFNRVLGRRLQRITAVSRDLAGRLAAEEGFARRDIDVVPNGVDAERWAAAARGGRDQARARLGLTRESVIVGTVGRLHAVKNQQLLVHTVAALRPRIPNLALALIGDGPEREALAGLAERLGIADAVHFLGQRRDVESLLPALDVFALSSSSEGVPLSLLEAMAARVPIVAVASGGVPEAVGAEREALLIHGPSEGRAPALVVAELAAAIARLLGDAALRRRLTEASAERVRVAFALDAMCRRHGELLSALAGSRNGGRAAR